jgi:uroporphyrinogen-III synthase
LDATLTRLEKLEDSIGSVKKMIEAVNSDPTVGAQETLKKLSNRLKKLEQDNSAGRSKDGKTIEGLADQVAALEKKIPTTFGDSQSSIARALVLSIGQLREAVRAGRPFGDELSALKTLVEKTESLKNALANALTQLSTIAASGAPSLEILRRQFDDKAGKIVKAGLVPTEGSWVQKTISRLTESVKWRRTDNFVGNGVEAIVARTERALKFRDAEKAIKEMAALSEKPAGLAREWLQSARSNVVAEKALAELQTRAVAQMAAGQ